LAAECRAHGEPASSGEGGDEDGDEDEDEDRARRDTEGELPTPAFALRRAWGLKTDAILLMLSDWCARGLGERKEGRRENGNRNPFQALLVPDARVLPAITGNAVPE
jgi:hypothetical protein